MAGTEADDAPRAPDGEPGKPSCPQCGGRLIRIARRPLDRLLSRFSPVQRYRCERFNCQWEGNVRVPPSGANVNPDTRR